MKKKLFMICIIGLFSFIIIAYAVTSIENYFIKSVDVINDKLDEKDIIIFEEIIEDDTCHGKYLLNNGTIYSYSYKYEGEIDLNDKLSNMKKNVESKLDKMKKKDKGYLSMYAPKLKYSYFKRTIKSDRPNKKIYYIDYKDYKLKVVNSSGEEVMKNKSFSASRVISILKKYN